MMENILAFGTPGPLEILVILVVLGIMVALVIVFLKILLRNKKENIRLRLEVGKLADELEQARKQKDPGEGVSVKESG